MKSALTLRINYIDRILNNMTSSWTPNPHLKAHLVEDSDNNDVVEAMDLD